MGSHQQRKMGEGSKQVRVDNWGIFFLQRLQMFFNKTDYCDLTLQFEGNVQLKVHRLVMNACTEYFRILEQTCEMTDDVLIMPPDLQADVVLPIVNFMYTGMLEFHMSIFDKLYKTANLMNITVLTKLLDAQKTPILPLPKSTNKKNMQLPHTWNLQGKKVLPKTMDPDLPAPLPGRKLPIWKRKSAPPAIPHTVLPHFFPDPKKQVDPLANFDNAPKPTRFEWPDDDISSLNVFDSSFDDITYTSKPLLTKSEEPKPSTSFDRIKETPDSGRRTHHNYDDVSVDMDDMKDYVNEQKLRTHLQEEDDEDSNFNIGNSLKRKIHFDQNTVKRVRFNVNEKENQKAPRINIMPTGKFSSDVDHTKIISEVLKKYPNLVKKNKNIRLKILAKNDSIPTPVALENAAKPILKKHSQNQFISPKANMHEEKNEEEGPWRCDRCSTPTETVDFILYYLYRKHMTDVHDEKFDSRMCKYCGHKTAKPNLLLYHQYTRHGIKPPPSYKFPKCNLCPYIALSEPLLIKHKRHHNKYELQCAECNVTFINKQTLSSHVLITGHNGKLGKHNFDCQYCIKKFQSASTLFAHIRVQHREEARRDGIVSIDETEGSEEEDEPDQMDYLTSDRQQDRKEKVKILSDVKLPSMEIPHSSSDSLDQHNLVERSSEAEALNNVASGIATSLGLVDVVVLDENQQYILHTDNQRAISSGESEFILPDLQDTRTFTTTQQVITSEQNVITQTMLQNSDIGSTDELVMVLTDHDYGDGNNEIINNENSNIVVLYSHPIEGQENQFISSQGNIMLTSQTGLIELRNTNTVVTSTGTFINNVQNPHIESIEMIQREINQHPNINNIKGTEVVPQVLPPQIIMLSNKQTETQFASEQTQIETKCEPSHNVEKENEIVESKHVILPAIPDKEPLNNEKVAQEVLPAVPIDQPSTTAVVYEPAEMNIPSQDQVLTNSPKVQTELIEEDTNKMETEHSESDNRQKTVDQGVQVEESQQSDESEVRDKVTEEGLAMEPSVTEIVNEPVSIDVYNAVNEENIDKMDEEVITVRENVVTELGSQDMTADKTVIETEGNAPNEEESKVDERDGRSVEMEVRGNETEDRGEEMEGRADETESSANETERKADEMEGRADKTETRAGETETKAGETETTPDEIETRAGEIETSSSETELRAHETEVKEDEANETEVREDEAESVADEAKVKSQEPGVIANTETEDSVDNEIEGINESIPSIENSNMNEEISQSEESMPMSTKSQEEEEQTNTEDVISNGNNIPPMNPVSQNVPDKVTTSQQISDKSARTILEDWEDTDSQQSDTKSLTNVNKLIDDWDDDEDDKKS